MKIVEISQKIEQIVEKNDLYDISSLLKDEHAISKSEELQEAISQMDEDGRVLQIGIVGRVKAGKSSLLNALVFDGKDILPKAATPMTAALTALEYSDETKAEVEFFSQKDIDEIQNDHEKYIAKFEKLRKIELEKLKKIKLKKETNLSNELQKELVQKATTRASSAMRADDKLHSAYDQYEKIKASGTNLEELAKHGTIEAKDTTELNNKLLDFVGSSGKYMPFTKSVTLKLDQESLKDIKIVDTPGVNDPVTSREDRTKELLKFCDVILVISPSGQFLSSEDIDLMDRITAKEGVREIYLVASQVDNQLFGSEKDKGGAILGKVLDVIETNLTNQQKTTLMNLKKQHPMIGDTFDSLIENNVVLTSGISYSMMKSFDDKNSWDENTQTVWNNLSQHYGDFFGDKDTAMANLNKLANIDKIKSIVDEVRIKKDDIQKVKKDAFVSTKTKALLLYKQAIEQDIKENIKRVQDADIDEIRKRKEQMLSKKDSAIDEVNDVYSDAVDLLDIELSGLISDKLKGYFRQSKGDIRESEGTDTKTSTKDHGFWSWKFGADRYETRTETFTTVKAGIIQDSLMNLTADIEDTIDKDSKEKVFGWRKELDGTIVGKLREVAGDEILDIKMISKTIKGIINSVGYPNIEYSGDFPEYLKKSGTLTSSEAQRYMDDASNYVNELQSRVRTDVKQYISSLITKLKEQKIGENIFDKYTKEIEKLESDIQNKELSLERFNNILTELRTIDG